jgi:glutamate/tyrosine decarboxylase-like PLP-dependent enzyme
MTESPFRPALESALQSALAHLDGLDRGPVSATATLAELRANLGKQWNAEPIPSLQVVDELVRDTAGGLLGSAGGRFFAWAIGGSIPAALAADWLTSAWDQNAALYACAPAAAVVEEVAGDWLKQVLGLPPIASFALVTGCQMAHATCLAAARNELLRRRNWDVERDGLSGAPRIRVLASNRHGSIERAVRLLGIGEGNVVDLPLDATERTAPATLEAALREHRADPLIVVLQAGDLNTGSFDRYRELIPIAREYSAWVHIDGAFGLWIAASAQHRALLDGFETADSWATDGHKWLNVPFDCGYAFVANPQAHRAAMSHRASYLVHDADARDQIDWNPEWSRRGRGFATYAALRALGSCGMEDLVDRCCRHAKTLVAGLGLLPGVQVLWPPVINQGLVRFLDPAAGADDSAHDRQTDLVIARLASRGDAFFMGTTWRGRRAMRVSVLNWQTQHTDVERAIAAVREAIAGDHPEAPGLA